MIAQIGAPINQIIGSWRELVHHRVQHAVKDIMHAMIDITLAQPALFDF